MILIDLTLNTPQNLVPGQGGAMVKPAGKLLPEGKETLGTELPVLPKEGKGRRSFGALNGKLPVFPALSNLELAVQSDRLPEADKERKIYQTN